MVEFDDIIDIFPGIFQREPSSVFARYVDAHQDEADDFGNRLDQIRDSHFVDQASGSDLDRIGAMFGKLGQREGRNDKAYRIYLKSIVQSYKGAGTVPGIRESVAAGLGVNESEVSIEEHFTELEYTIELDDWPAHDGTTVEELADLSDASVSQLRKTRYKIEDEELATDDTVSIRPGLAIEDIVSLVDDVVVDGNNPTVTESATTTDAVAVDGDGPDVTDGMLTQDDVSVLIEYLVETPRWEPTSDTASVDWDGFEWMTLEELARSLSDGSVSSDSVAVDPNVTIVSDGSLSGDSTNTSSQTVEWGADWGTMNWGGELDDSNLKLASGYGNNYGFVYEGE